MSLGTLSPCWETRAYWWVKGHLKIQVALSHSTKIEVWLWSGGHWKKPGILLILAYAHACVCKVIYKHQHTHIQMFEFIFFFNEGIHATDPAPPHAFLYSHGHYSCFIWSWWLLMVFCMNMKRMDRLCAPPPQGFVSVAVKAIQVLSGFRQWVNYPGYMVNQRWSKGLEDLLRFKMW